MAEVEFVLQLMVTCFGVIICPRIPVHSPLVNVPPLEQESPSLPSTSETSANVIVFGEPVAHTAIMMFHSANSPPPSLTILTLSILMRFLFSIGFGARIVFAHVNLQVVRIAYIAL